MYSDDEHGTEEKKKTDFIHIEKMYVLILVKKKR